MTSVSSSHPPTLADLLDLGVRVYQRQFVPLGLIVVTLLTPVILVQDLWVWLWPQSTRLPLLLIPGVVALAEGALVQGLTHLAAGHPITVGRAYALPLWRYLTLLVSALGVIILVVLPIMGAGLWLGLSIDFDNSESVNDVTILNLWATLGAALIGMAGMIVLLQFVPHGIVMEHMGVVRSIRRSWRVSSAAWRWVLAATALSSIIHLIAQLPLVGLLLFSVRLRHGPIDWDATLGLYGYLLPLGLTVSLPAHASIMTVLYNAIKDPHSPTLRDAPV